MNDKDTASTDFPEAKPAPSDTRTAKIRTLCPGVKAKGFTFGAKQVVDRVPLAHAEFLVSKGQAEILEVV